MHVLHVLYHEALTCLPQHLPRVAMPQPPDAGTLPRVDSA